MREEIAPTLTLAKLYETQLELVDAVNIYALLQKKKPSPEIEKKIKELTDILFEKITRDYDAPISEIFSQEELRYFRIIPGETVQISKNGYLSNESKIAVIQKNEENLEVEKESKEVLENNSSSEEIKVSNVELNEIEKLLQSKPHSDLENLINDESTLQQQKETLLKKLETVEQKLKRLAEEDKTENDISGAADLEITENTKDERKVNFTHLNEARSEPVPTPEEDKWKR